MNSPKHILIKSKVGIGKECISVWVSRRRLLYK